MFSLTLALALAANPVESPADLAAWIDARVEASAKAKIANVATNLCALVVFAPGGHIMVKVGLVMAASNLLGGYVGARTAVRLGSGFVRVVFIVVVSAFIVRISLQLLGVWP